MSPLRLRARAVLFRRRLTANQRGVLWILLSGLIFVLVLVGIKHLGARLSSFEIMFVRSLLVLVMMVPPVVARNGIAVFRTAQPGMMFVRSTLGALSVAAMFYAFTKMPLADATTIGFSRALFTTVLAIFLLGEVVGFHRWAATIVGFTGVVLILRPGSQGVDPAAIAALLGALCNAAVSVVVRRLSRSEGMVALMIYPGVMVLVVSLAPTLWTWLTPTPGEFLIMLLISVMSLAGQICFLRGYRAGEASVLAPVDYVQLLLAVLFGFLIFDEVPDLATIAGAAIIVVSTLYTLHRERRRERVRIAPPPA